MATGLLRNFALALDPCWMLEKSGRTPDWWQQDILLNIPHRLLLLLSRQFGKSTTAAVIALHFAIFYVESLILLVSPSLRQSSELFRKVMDIYRVLDLGDEARTIMESRLRLELSNGSRIISLPGSESTIRGFSNAAIVIVDEAARVPDDLMAAVRPTLATSNGHLIAMSTPFGRRGWFYREWNFGGATWQRLKLAADQCPRISEEFLEEERRSLGELMYRSEYLCEFLDAQSAMFSSVLIEGAVSDDIKPLWS